MKFNYTEFNLIDLGNNKHVIYLKPVGTIIFMFILSAVLILTFNLKFVLFGIFILVNAIIVFHTVKNRPVISFFEKGVVIFDKATSQPSVFIPWEMIKQWRYKTGVAFNDQLVIYTVDEEIFTAESFKGAKIFKYFNEYAKGKEQTIQLLRNKGTSK